MTTESLPFKPPAITCNARNMRQTGYCLNPAGFGTEHDGWGRCRLHGGLGPKHDVADGPRDLFHANGLSQILNLAETMTKSDGEYLHWVGTNAMQVIRARITARMMEADITAKELSDLTMALSRVDGLLSKYPNDENPDAAPNTPDKSEVEEMKRLWELERQLA